VGINTQNGFKPILPNFLRFCETSLEFKTDFRESAKFLGSFWKNSNLILGV
jgi:hypothetical protein